MSRILVGGLIGGIVVFVWGAISHMALPLGKVGFSHLPDQESVAEVLRAQVHEPGLYFLPDLPTDPRRTGAQKAADEEAWRGAYRRGPSGILVIDPAGKDPLSPRTLVIELVTNILGAAIAALLLTMARIPSFWARVLFVTMLGAFASVAIDLSYWNWYGFPDSYTVAAFFDQVLGWFFGGLVLAWIVRPG
jgi:hypothetical protein